jgi:hypothetical protein
MAKEKAAPRAINLKKVSSAGHGHVKAIRQGSEYGPENDDGLAEITIKHGKDPKNNVKGGLVSSHDVKTSRVHIPQDKARGLKIGQKVRIHLEHC